MSSDRLLNLLRWVVAPIIIAAITGYYESRVSTAKTQAKEQTRASYDTLAPNVLELQDKVSILTGRIEEIARRPVFLACPESLKAAGKPASHVEAPKPVAKPGLTELLGGTGAIGKTEVMVDSAPSAPPKKVPARFEDMIQQQAK